MHITLIWAMAENRVIGRDNDLPWNLPKDMQHFRQTTRGKPVVMGRKTFVSMPGALPGRKNIVITRDPQWAATGAEVVHDLDSGIALATTAAKAASVDEIMIIGGSEIYAMAMPRATRLHITWVHAEPAGDVFFPAFDLNEWQEVRAERFEPDEQHALAFTIAYYERRQPLG